MTGPHVDIVVPVRNEERDLAPSVWRLVTYLRESFPFHARITIADNGSTDATWAIAGRLARELPEVRAVHMDLPGRGRALRAIWSRSDAEVLAYMDVDLSTDLRALLPLVAPLLSGHSDLAIGTRLARGAHVSRSPKRELISRTYNHLLHAAGSRVLRFVAIGIVSTLAYALLYLVLRDWLASGAANALALATTAVGNTAANRRLTFGVRGRD